MVTWEEIKEGFKKGRFVIEYDKKDCIGAGSCEIVYPENWVLDEDGLAEPKKKEIDTLEELERNLEAARVCPVRAIKIKDLETGEYLDL